MVSRKHSGVVAPFLARVARLLLVCLLLAGAGAAGHCDPDYKELKKEIQALEKSVDEADRERRDADTKLADNRTAQKTATGNDLKKLKSEAIDLARKAGEKADALATAQQRLANKQGELRETAAAHAVKQLTASGDIETRAGEANSALDDWKTALGTLPEVPALRSLEGIDPDDQADIRAGDKKKLEAYEKWASDEETRIDKEIKQAKEIVDGESKWKASVDGGAEVTSTAKSLKTTLETRKTKVGELRKSAKELLRQIK